MGATNDFFGEPLFQPTGTDWIDHAFTAAMLDEMDEEDGDIEGGAEPDDDGISIEVSISFGDNEEVGGSADLADAMDAANDAIQSAAIDIAALIGTLESAKNDLEPEEPEDICSETWEAWNEQMEKLGDLIGDLEIALGSAG